MNARTCDPKPAAAAGRGMCRQDPAPALSALHTGARLALGRAGLSGTTAHLGERDGLLLHGLMDCHAVVFSHLHGGEKRPSDPGEGGAEQWQKESYSSNHSRVLTPCWANGRNWVISNPGDNYVGLALLSPLSRCGN